MSTTTPTAPATHSTAPAGDHRPRATRRDADGTAVASFVIGLLGTVVFNIVFGPLALVLGTVALARRTRRPGRAALGIVLGLADIALLATLVSVHHNITWTPGF